MDLHTVIRAAVEIIGHNDITVVLEDGAFDVQSLDEVSFPADVQAQILARAEEIKAAPAPSQLPRAVVTGLVELAIEGEDVSGVGTVVNFGGALLVEPGRIWSFFSEPQPDTNYIVTAQAPGFNADVNYPLNPDFIEITVTSRVSGEPVNPPRLVLDVKRVQ